MLEEPIISQVWHLLESYDDDDDQLPHHSEKLRRSSNTSSDGVDNGVGRRLSLKKLLQPRWLKVVRTASRRGQQDEQQRALSLLEEPNNDDTWLLTKNNIAAIPSTEIDLVSYIVAHGILNKKLRWLTASFHLR